MAAKTPTRVNPKSVTILAMGPTTMQYISQIGGQFERPTKHVWAINNAGMWFHDIDLIIAMDDFKRDSKTHPKYVKALTNRGVPVLTCTAHEEYPSLQEYPTAEVMEYLRVNPDFAPHPLDNSCNYALAYAMYLGMTEIHLYGFEFRAAMTKKAYIEAQKYAMERYGRVPEWFGFYMKEWLPRPGEPGEESCHWLLGLCHGRGIKIRCSEDTTLLSASLPKFFYGFQDQPDL
ncbi:hypothetical protein LCGC14_2836400 [marine sediment metagenome]|uniref:Uncharacterized protein n=1 Tax=marine sediment metagenome TaxID=412755 RepID=A0A0F8YZ57_9ZZZZ